MKTIKVIIGIIIAFFSTKTIFEMYNEESGAGLFGAFSGYIIFMAIAIWLIYSGSKDEVTKVKNVNLENAANSAKNYDKNRTDIDNLKDLKEKGILTEEEYNQKANKIESEKKEENLKNSQEYKQLKSLFDNGVLTKEEFESKIKRLSTNKTTSKNISIILNDKRVLIVSNNFKNNLIGSKVKFENNDTILNGNFLSERKLIVISNGFIKNILNGQIVYLNNNQKVIIYKQFDSVISLNDFVYYNNEKIKDGIYQISFLKNFTVSNGKIINISFLLNIL